MVKLPKYRYLYSAYFFDGAEQYAKDFEVVASHEKEADGRVKMKTEMHSTLTGDECVDYFWVDIIPEEE